MTVVAASSAAWPASLTTIAEAIGEAATARLVEARAGRRIYIPLDPRPEHKVAQLIGLEAARSLAELAGGGAIEIPLARPIARSSRRSPRPRAPRQRSRRGSVSRRYARRVRNG